MGCVSGLSRFLLCIFNFIFFVIGVIVLGIGIWLVADKSSFIGLLKSVDHEQVQHFTAPAVIDQLAYVLIACGAITFFLSFLGYCGAIRESTCLLYTYGAVMILILVAEIAVGVTAYAMKDTARAETKKFLSSTIKDYYATPDRSDAVTLMWNNIMLEMECCGVDSYKDFEQAHKWITMKNTTIPAACCKFEDKEDLVLMDRQCPNSPSDSNSNQNRGCYDSISDWIYTHRQWVIITIAVIAVVELILILLSFYLSNAINRYRRMPMCASYE